MIPGGRAYRTRFSPESVSLLSIVVGIFGARSQRFANTNSPSRPRNECDWVFIKLTISSSMFATVRRNEDRRVAPTGGPMGISQRAALSSASLVSIQALRGVAAVMVLVGHATTALIVEHKATNFPNFSIGPFGVDLFFVISGFVMVYSSERLFGQPDAPRKFFARRLARIVPLYWATTSVFIWFVVPYASTKAVLGSYFFAPHVPSEAPLLFVGWTLIYEMFFYTVFSIALFARRCLAVVAGAGVFLILFALLVPAPKDASVGFFAPPASHSFAYLADPIIVEFVFGMIIALAYRAGIRLSLQATIASIAVAVVWYGLAVPAISRQYSCGFAAALIVAGMSLSSLPTPKSAPIVRPAVFVGDISYALYLTHMLAFAFLAWITAAFGINPLDYLWAYAGMMLATALLVATATHLMFEKPMTKSLQNWIEHRPLAPVKPVLTS
jgi:exopolysaccharide production protein ExoZ